MSAANPIPELEGLSGRAFSFYPPILNVEHNEWRLREATWSEILVHNTNCDQEIWVPRRFVGAISRVEEPVMIVGSGARTGVYRRGFCGPMSGG